MLEFQGNDEKIEDIIFNMQHPDFWRCWKSSIYVYELVGKSSQTTKDFLYIGKEAAKGQYYLKMKLEMGGHETSDYIEMSSPSDLIYFFTTLYLHWESNPKRNTSFFRRATKKFQLIYKRSPKSNLFDFNILLNETLMTVHEWIEEIYWITYIDKVIVEEDVSPKEFSKFRFPKSKTLLFNEKNMKHIIEGDLGYSNAPFFNSEQIVIKGGLHSSSKFEKFMQQRKEEDETFYRLNVNFLPTHAEKVYKEIDKTTNPLGYTYHLRKSLEEKHYNNKKILGNGVEIHMVPRELVNANQWKMISNSPCKTLFPKEMGEGEIQNVIQQVVRNPLIILSQRRWCTTYIGEGAWSINQDHHRIWLSVTVKNEDNTVITAYPIDNQPDDIFEKIIFKRVLYTPKELLIGEANFKEFVEKLTKISANSNADTPFPVPILKGKFENLACMIYTDKPINKSIEFINYEDRTPFNHYEILKEGNSVLDINAVFDMLDHLSFRAPRLYISFMDTTNNKDVLNKLADTYEHRDDIIQRVVSAKNHDLLTLLAKPMGLLNLYDEVHQTIYSFDLACKFFKNFLITYTPVYALKAIRDASDRMRILTEFTILNLKRNSKVVNKYLQLLLGENNFIKLFPVEMAKGMYLLFSFMKENWSQKNIKFNINTNLLFKLFKEWHKFIIKKIKSSYVILATSTELSDWEYVVKELYEIFKNFLSQKNIKQYKDMKKEFLDMYYKNKQKRVYSKSSFQFSKGAIENDWMIDNVYQLERSDFFINYKNPNQIRMWVSSW